MMNSGDIFSRLVSDDEFCARVMQAVAENDEKALRELGFGGFGEFVQRLSDMMTESLRQGIGGESLDFAGLMGEAARPVHYAHHLVNEAGAAVQAAKDKPLGIRIKPAETVFSDERLKSAVADAVEKDTHELTVLTLASEVGTMVKAMGNDFIKVNAEARSRVGFEVKIKRTGSSKACKWCAARIGTWTLAGAPDGVFGCHDNCSCVVEYTSSTGTVSRRNGTGRFVEVQYQPPHVGVVHVAEKSPHRLTKPLKRGTMLPDVIIGRSVGAKAKNYEIMDLKTGEKFYLVEGSHLQNVEVFAGRGGYKPYNNAWKYARDFGGKVEDWQHVKGFGLVDYYGEEREAELHWSQCDGFGKHDFFIKRWLDEG